MEHELARHPGLAIRMFDEATNEWVNVGGAKSRAIRLYMRARARELVDALASDGLRVQAADRPVKIDQETRSVDLRVWCMAEGTEAIVEVKWTRGLLTHALRDAKQSLPWLKTACARGRWYQAKYQKAGKAVKATAVGALAVGPASWSGVLEGAMGGWSRVLPSPNAALRCRRYPSGSSKRKGNPGRTAKEKEWRQTQKGKALTKRLVQKFRQTEKGSAGRQLETATRPDRSGVARRRPACAGANQ